MSFAETARRLLDWLREAWVVPDTGLDLFADDDLPSLEEEGLERPWRYRWDHLPKQSAGFGFTDRDYRAARTRAEEIARLTVGDEVWGRVKRSGHVDLPSRRYPGVTYRLRIGRRIEVRCEPGVQSPWRHP
ncbi:MAG: hypothetical protein IT338_03110, partial [Thermomicrobiales bacterium]|nr:hypothetical protein [Thermomicrobiales bacterium]